MSNQSIEEKKWHKNYTRLMPYYYVNHKAKLVYTTNPNEEKQVRIRKIVKSASDLVLEVVEKVENQDNTEKKNRKRLKEETLTISWVELEEISFQVLKSSKWKLNFIR